MQELANHWALLGEVKDLGTMGGGNAQKSATSRARNEAKKAKAAKGSQLAVNKAACNVICQVPIARSIVY